MNQKKNPQLSEIAGVLLLPASQIGALGLVCIASFVGFGSIAGAQSTGNLLTNGSFENRTSPPPPTSGFSNGVPDDWTSSSTSTYEFEIFIGGLSSIDDVVIFQLAQSLEEMFDSFVPLVSDAEIVIDSQQAGLGLLFDETLLAEKETSRLRAGGWLADTGATRSEGIESQDRVIGTLTYGSKPQLIAGLRFENRFLRSDS